MNAYELANELDKYKGIATRDAATMLRQQADRIAELEKSYPVKQLSDEEIEAILKKSMVIKGVWGQPMQELDPMVFARAIIKEITE